MRLAQLYCCVGGRFSRIGAGGAANTLRPAFVCRSHIINPHILKCKVYQDIFRASVHIGRGPFLMCTFQNRRKRTPGPFHGLQGVQENRLQYRPGQCPLSRPGPFLRRGGSQGIIREKAKQKPCNHYLYSDKELNSLITVS